MSKGHCIGDGGVVVDVEADAEGAIFESSWSLADTRTSDLSSGTIRRPTFSAVEPRRRSARVVGGVLDRAKAATDGRPLGRLKPFTCQLTQHHHLPATRTIYTYM